MKISKSFKITTFIFIGFLFVNNPFAYSELPSNLVIHDKPKKITNIIFKDNNLQEVDLSKNKGKIMVLNFWATWCAPCKKEMPSLEKLTFKYPEIKVFAVNTERPNKIRTRDFFRSVGVTTLNTYYDPQLNLVKTFKLRGLPTSILIDKDGKEFGRVIGEVDFASEDFLNLMKKYI